MYKEMPKDKKIAFGWYGGKFIHLEWLLPLLPECNHYVEPFAGSASVLLNKKPSPLETFNDIDGELVNFFRVLRDQPAALVRQISLTPIARAEFVEAIHGGVEGLSDLERARRFYIRARQTRMGLGQTAKMAQWANCISVSSSGMADIISRWQHGCAGLDELAARFLSVQIENRPAVDVMRIYDTPETLFYCDPPYLPETRKSKNNYAFEMTEADHEAFLQSANEIKGLVAISGYESDLYMDMLPEGDWLIHSGPEKLSRASTYEHRREVLWTNYDPDEFNRQYSLF